MTKEWKWIIVGLVAVLFLVWLATRNTPKAKKVEPYCDRNDATYHAQRAVKINLNNPDEADFQDVRLISASGNAYYVKGWVTATNAFNAKIKNNFAVRLTCDGSEWAMSSVRIGDFHEEYPNAKDTGRSSTRARVNEAINE